MLCELADVRGFLQKREQDTEQDEQIKALIVAAGSVIGEFCEREFEPPDPDKPNDDLARTFEYRGEGLLSLAPFDLREVTSIRIDVDADEPGTLAADEYRLPPSSSGTHTYLRLAPQSWSTSRWPQRLVEVTGKWGFESVPATVKQAAILTVAIWLRRDVAAFTTTFNIDEARVERPESLPIAAVRMLAPFKRHEYA